jgi:hypothetical protein
LKLSACSPPPVGCLEMGTFLGMCQKRRDIAYTVNTTGVSVWITERERAPLRTHMETPNCGGSVSGVWHVGLDTQTYYFVAVPRMSEVRRRHTLLFVTKVGTGATWSQMGNSDPSVPFPARHLQLCDSSRAGSRSAELRKTFLVSPQRHTHFRAQGIPQWGVLFRTCLRYTARLRSGGTLQGTIAFSACLGGSSSSFFRSA